MQCHSEAEAHVLGVSTGHFVSPVEHLSALSSEGISDLCGRCHRTWSIIIMNGLHGLDNVRFQPYRLARSKCYNATDRRISCVACHDPHHQVKTSPEAYDGKCSLVIAKSWARAAMCPQRLVLLAPRTASNAICPSTPCQRRKRHWRFFGRNALSAKASALATDYFSRVGTTVGRDDPSIDCCVKRN